VEILESYETLEAIPEDIRENYSEGEDGTFSLTLVKGLKSALGKERQFVKERDIKLATQRDENEGAITSAIARRESELQEEFRTREESIRKEALETSQSARKKAAVAVALQKVGGNILLLEEKVAAQLAIDENGEAYVASKDGTPLLDENGNRQSVDGLVATFRADPNFAGAFKGNGQSGGGGAGAETGNGGVMQMSSEPQFRSQMTPKEKVAFINEHGNDKFQSLPF
jgi:hypothetical protein